MNTIKWILPALLSLVFASNSFAGHHSHQYKSGHPHSKNKYAVHKAGHHYREAHHKPAEHHQHQQNYEKHPGYKVYRSGKHRTAYRDDRRYDHRYKHRYEHRLSYDYDRRDTYRLIAGAIVLNEVLHHVHH